MSHDITVTFLGTTSGGGPTQTRNCSSLVADLAGDGSLWMFDCAEGTVRQFENQPYRPGYQRVRVNQVSKIFITHMHADHTMGILTFLRNILGIPKPVIDPDAPPANKSSTKVEIFGPRGIRRMIRMLWNVTHTRSSQAYIVHELLFPGEQPSVPAEVRAGEGADETDVRNASEKVGRDIHCDEAGYWPRIVNREIGGQRGCGLIVDAGPIQHRDPCIGYVIREVPREPLTAESPLPRKLVILGDTYDPSPLAPLVHDEPPFASPLPERDPWGHDVPVKIPVSLLVHEATDAHIPAHVDPSGRTGKNRTPESVREKAISRGHSTPGMAGAFARTIAAERLVMNHIGARFPAPVGELTNMSNPQTKLRHGIVREMARQAAEGWCPDGSRPVHTEVAVDFHVVTIRPNRNAPTAPVRGSATPCELDINMSPPIHTTTNTSPLFSCLRLPSSRQQHFRRTPQLAERRVPKDACTRI
ncbi:beta-lactamase-like protein [Epithele typhae]|uniref:beta-lactamase-like protein n=1 Tax=Epithele typhae TaxID=378194 RepID=UPI0020074637|nr:beta-lactamase-like protein [Epithele typhae]KAH9925676.1 beta-lactamase-like protein [Epithele typhae]